MPPVGLSAHLCSGCKARLGERVRSAPVPGSANAGLQITALSFAEMDESVAGRLADKTQRRHHGSAKLKLQAKSASSPRAACASSSFFDSKIDMLHAGRDAIFQGGSTSGRFFCTPKGCNGTAWIVQCVVQYPTMCTLTLV